MFEAPSKTGNNEKDMSLIFDTFERWAVEMRKVETNIKLLQAENELLREQIS